MAGMSPNTLGGSDPSLSVQFVPIRGTRKRGSAGLQAGSTIGAQNVASPSGGGDHFTINPGGGGSRSPFSFPQ
jgi:hypothetical protein